MLGHFMKCSIRAIWFGAKGKLFISAGDHKAVNNRLQNFSVAYLHYKFSGLNAFSIGHLTRGFSTSYVTLMSDIIKMH